MEKAYPDLNGQLAKAAHILTLDRIPQPLRIGIAMSHLNRAAMEYRKRQLVERAIPKAPARQAPEEKVKNLRPSERAGVILAGPSRSMRQTWAENG